MQSFIRILSLVGRTVQYVPPTVIPQAVQGSQGRSRLWRRRSRWERRGAGGACGANRGIPHEKGLHQGRVRRQQGRRSAGVQGGKAAEEHRAPRPEGAAAQAAAVSLVQY